MLHCTANDVLTDAVNAEFDWIDKEKQLVDIFELQAFAAYHTLGLHPLCYLSYHDQ